MRSKKERQKANKFRHLKEVGKTKRQRRQDPQLNRKRPSRTVLPVILIACEGQNTEPSYFNQFEIKTVEVEPRGDGYSHLSLVHWAEKLAKAKKYDEIWCVFDADPKPNDPNWAHNFNNAIWAATKKGYKVGYSHQAFEYWLILHFDDHQGASMSRTEYNDKLNELIKPFGLIYDGNGTKKVTAGLFDLLMDNDLKSGKPRTEIAICRAKKIYDKYDHRNPSQEESSTTIFKLVHRLLNFDKKKKISISDICQ